MTVVSPAPSIHSVRRVFPSTAGSQSFQSRPSARIPARLTAPLRSPHHPLCPGVHILLRGHHLTVVAIATRQLAHRPLAPVRLCCPHPPRYYGLIRRSPGLRTASFLIPHGLCVSRCPGHLPFFALSDLLRL